MTTSEAPPPHRYALRLMPEALAEWQTLDGSVRAPRKKLFTKCLEQPHVPGGALHGPLAGCYKIKLLKQGVRLVHAVEDHQRVVLVLAVGQREDGLVDGDHGPPSEPASKAKPPEENGLPRVLETLGRAHHQGVGWRG